MHERFLKSIVIGLGLLIVFGVGFLGYAFYQKSINPAWRPFGGTPGTAATTVDAPAAIGDVNLDLPDGCLIGRVWPHGRRLYVKIGPKGPCNRVVVLEAATGRILGTIRSAP